MNYLAVLRAVCQTGFLFGLCVWIYIAMNAVFHPETLSLPLTHVLSFPREDTTGIVAFAVSSVSFFVLRLISERERDR